MAIDLGTTEYNAMIKDIGHVTFGFFVVPMCLLYTIQQTAVQEMKERENGLLGRLKILKEIITSLKNTVKETENNAKTMQDDRQQLDVFVTLTCSSFIEEGITPEMFSKEKNFRIGEINENLGK